MEVLAKELIQELLSVNHPPGISLYMTTHRSHPENLQDPIRFQNLVKQLEESLLEQYPAVEVKKLLEPYLTLSNNSEFWGHTLDGLAVLGSTEFFKVIRLPVVVEELAIVADSFHTKPIRQYLQSVDRYHVLGLSLHEIKLFEGNRHSLVEVELPSDFPRTITEALGEELTDQHTTVASYGGTSGESSDMHHGHGGKKDEVDKDAERFFNIIARTIHEKYSKPTGWPLILAALSEHHSLFQKLSKNPLLLKNGINVNPDSISNDKLVKLAWEVLEPVYLQKLKDLVEKFEQAKANNSGSDNVKEVVEAAEAGRVDTILIEKDRVIAERLRNKNTGTFKQTDLTQPKLDDLLDDIGELVTKMGGKVMFIPSEKMPAKTGIAALYRY
ncbi:MAG TPA: hypothetical protein VK870_04800 [Ignavibacteriaceae bacterium]|nr:hypothetical protein [Ignavibacteriaceae bacterium]